MSSVNPPNPRSDVPTAGMPVSNTVALIGLILAGVAGGLCVLMFAMANQLPDSAIEFSDLKENSPTHLRLLILGCSTVVLVVVAFVLCVVGLFLPHRPRVLAVLGTVLSLLIMLGVFGVLIVGVVMNPAMDPPDSKALSAQSKLSPDSPPSTE